MNCIGGTSYKQFSITHPVILVNRTANYSQCLCLPFGVQYKVCKKITLGFSSGAILPTEEPEVFQQELLSVCYLSCPTHKFSEPKVLWYFPRECPVWVCYLHLACLELYLGLLLAKLLVLGNKGTIFINNIVCTECITSPLINHHNHMAVLKG